MCLEVIYDYDGLEVRTAFDNPRARLPVRRRGGGALLLTWGRRPRQRGALPSGGWARLESIRAGEWDQWFPRPVKLPLQRFAERDGLGEEDARKRLAAQFPLEKKIELADFVIDTDGSLDETETRARAVWNALTAE